MRLNLDIQKTIDELGDKISGEEKAKAEVEIESVKNIIIGFTFVFIFLWSFRKWCLEI